VGSLFMGLIGTHAVGGPALGAFFDRVVFQAAVPLAGLA
jgi:hypothetical protein